MQLYACVCVCLFAWPEGFTTCLLVFKPTQHLTLSLPVFLSSALRTGSAWWIRRPGDSCASRKQSRDGVNQRPRHTRRVGSKSIKHNLHKIRNCSNKSSTRKGKLEKNLYRHLMPRAFPRAKERKKLWAEHNLMRGTHLISCWNLYKL